MKYVSQDSCRFWQNTLRVFVRSSKQLKHSITFIFFVLVIGACKTENENPQVDVPSIPTSVEGFGWELVWSDEFNGTELNGDFWTAETGDGSQYGISGWGNNELQWYLPENAQIIDGKLRITAKQETVNSYNYTSARLKTAGKVDVKYGRIEARMKLPEGQGSWPAFWMLPTDSPYGGWAAGGEIDILEATNLGVDGNNKVSGTLHYGMQWPLNQYQSREYAPTDISFTDDFQVIAVEWDADEIRWYVNNVHYATQMKRSWWTYFYSGLNSGFQASTDGPFDQPFHILLNFAVGGDLPGSPDASSIFPMTMDVDYIRVYQCRHDPITGKGCTSYKNRQVNPPPSHEPFVAIYPIYNDGIQPLEWSANDDVIQREIAFNSFWTNDGALTLSEVNGGERGSVIDVMTTNSGNFSVYAVDSGTFELFGMGSAASAGSPYAGEIIFDLYIDSTLTDPDSSIVVKMDSGWPNLGAVSLPVSELKKDEWQTLHIKISDLLANGNNGGSNPLNIEGVVSLFVVEPSSAAHLQVDNISLRCGFPSNNGCGIRPPSQAIDAQQINVFVDEVDELWSNGIGAWDSGVGTDYFVGDNPNTKVHWSIISDDTRGNIIDVTFDSNSATNGVFYIQSAQSVDLSGFDNGLLTFDLKVVDYGTNTNGMALKVDCVYPCSSGDQSLGVVANGEWQSFSINVSDLRNAGLDTSRVNTGLVIFPAQSDQQGVHFQLDNIIWYADGGTSGSSNPKPAADQDLLIYDGTNTSEFEIQPTLNGISMTELVDDVDVAKGNVLEFSFLMNDTNLPFFVQPAGSQLNMSDFATGTIEFDLLLTQAPDAGLDTTNFYIKFDSVYPKTTSALTIDKPELGVWKHYSINVADLLNNPNPDWEQPVNIENVDAVFVVSPDWGMANGTVFRLDNIRWTH